LIALLLLVTPARGGGRHPRHRARPARRRARQPVADWREDRDPLTSVAVVVVDKSPSQSFGDRTAQTEAARDALMKRLQRIPGLEVREVEAGQADAARPTARGSSMRSAPRLADVPPERIAGAFMINRRPRARRAGRRRRARLRGAAARADHRHPEGSANRRVVLVAAPRFGIVGQQQTVSFRVEDSGAPAGGTAQVKISRETGDPIDQRPRAHRRQHRGADPDPAFGCPNIVEIEASPLEGELTRVNNRAVVSIEGVRDKLRVLLVSGEPHSGERTWRNLLKSDPNVDLVHFTILRPPEKQDGTPINELSLIAFPTRELFQQKINEFQLIIFDRYARQGVLPIIYFDNIARYVRDGRRRDGGGRARLCEPDQHLAHPARPDPAGRAERQDDRGAVLRPASPTRAAATRSPAGSKAAPTTRRTGAGCSAWSTPRRRAAPA